MPKITDNFSVPLLHSSIFRLYDIRGIVDETIDEQCYHLIGRLLASQAIERDLSTCVVGYDGRLSSPKLADALAQGVMQSGIDVTMIGLAPTPMLYHASAIFGSGLALMVTGSHNPPNYNGIKIMMDNKPFFGDDIKALPKRAQQGKIINAEKTGNLTHKNIADDYIDFLLQQVTLNIGKPLKIGWDMGNGAAGEIIRQLTQKLEGEHHLIYEQIDGTFPNHHPDPSKPENMRDLQHLVKQYQLDLGIAFDGDGDRLGVVDNEDNMLYGDQLLPILAYDILQKNPNALILGDVKTSSAAINAVRAMGGKAFVTATGHSLIKTAMMEQQAIFAAEMSGHIFFADNHYFDDAIYAAIKLINRLYDAKQQSQKSLADLAGELPKMCHTPEIRIDIKEQDKQPMMQTIINEAKRSGFAYNDIDGIRIEDGDNWWLIRASNTENALVFRAEASNSKALKKLLQSAFALLTHLPPESLQKIKSEIDKSNA
ncbi:MAG: phosphomannomutase/phosphoglucomutase [Alphaproteobacteria bacterium]|nr:phosphomannomutase/phosphoglucomutase [Alphaproteobacteria bacterium]